MNPAPKAPKKSYAGYQLSPSQVSVLRKAGFPFQEAQLPYARKLFTRRFSAKQFQQAVVDVQRHHRGKFQLLSDVATFRLLGISFELFPKYQKSKYSLTEFYNRSYIGGHTYWLKGWLVFGLMTAPTTLFSAIWTPLVYRDVYRDRPPAGLNTALLGTITFAAIGLALASLAVSIVYFVRYRKKRKQWFPNGLLEHGFAPEILTWYRTKIAPGSGGTSASIGSPSQPTGLTLSWDGL